jgi:IS605 OrfB family transposase
MSVKTFSGRVKIGEDSKEAAALDAFGEIHGRGIGLCLKLLSEGKSLMKEKSSICRKLGISARHANSLRFQTKGMLDSVVSNLPGRLREAETRLKTAKDKIEKLETARKDLVLRATSKGVSAFVREKPDALLARAEKIKTAIHGKSRRLVVLKNRVDELNTKIEAAGKGAVAALGMCWGGKKLFHAQFDLKANGYPCLQAWRDDWRDVRSSQIFLVGSKDEASGCQSCRTTPCEESYGFDLRLRLPPAMEKEHGKHVVLKDVEFPQGAAALLSTLASGKALTWRFVRDGKGWLAFFSCDIPEKKQRGFLLAGALGIDVNAGHLSVSLCDRKGNLVCTRDIPLDLSGLDANQAKDVIGKAAASIAREADAAGVPVAREDLGFSMKKAKAEANGKKYNRMLSSFAHAKILDAVGSACEAKGVPVITVNPAWTSVMSKNHFAKTRKISVHQGAAWAIARRGLGCIEKKEWIKPKSVGKMKTKVSVARAVSPPQPEPTFEAGKKGDRDTRGSERVSKQAGGTPKAVRSKGEAVKSPVDETRPSAFCSPRQEAPVATGLPQVKTCGKPEKPRRDIASVKVNQVFL